MVSSQCYTVEMFKLIFILATLCLPKVDLDDRQQESELCLIRGGGYLYIFVWLATTQERLDKR
jgi:hypothetical protein